MKTHYAKFDPSKRYAQNIMLIIISTHESTCGLFMLLIMLDLNDTFPSHACRGNKHSYSSWSLLFSDSRGLFSIIFSGRMPLSMLYCFEERLYKYDIMNWFEFLPGIRLHSGGKDEKNITMNPCQYSMKGLRILVTSF